MRTIYFSSNPKDALYLVLAESFHDDGVLFKLTKSRFEWLVVVMKCLVDAIHLGRSPKDVLIDHLMSH